MTTVGIHQISRRLERTHQSDGGMVQRTQEKVSDLVCERSAQHTSENEIPNRTWGVHEERCGWHSRHERANGVRIEDDRWFGYAIHKLNRTERRSRHSSARGVPERDCET